MKVLVIGSGAREHALVAKMLTDPTVTALMCAPGNAGTRAVADSADIDVANPAGVAELAADFGAELVVVGPEVPLVNGAADACRARGIRTFGPSAAAARIESSKSWAKEVMHAAHVPTAHAHTFTAVRDALAHIDATAPPYVVKYDGLAAGKGVTVTRDPKEAASAVRDCLTTLGDVVVLEDFLDGPELSLFALTDGATVVPLVPAQDAKRVGDDDTGPNTGGMGAYTPVPWVPNELVDTIVDEVLLPTVEEMTRRGAPFTGLLYAGLALTAYGPQVVEFNCRFGDPETQVVLARLDSPLTPLLAAVADGNLTCVDPPRWSDDAAVTIVLAAHDYPGTPQTGDRIEGLADAAALPGVNVFHAGTATRDGTVVSAGGRVLSVTARASTLADARDSAYAAMQRIRLPGGHYRTDIALRAVRGEIEVPTPH